MRQLTAENIIDEICKKDSGSEKSTLLRYLHGEITTIDASTRAGFDHAADQFIPFAGKRFYAVLIPAEYNPLLIPERKELDKLQKIGLINAAEQELLAGFRAMGLLGEKEEKTQNEIKLTQKQNAFRFLFFNFGEIDKFAVKCAQPEASQDFWKLVMKLKKFVETELAELVASSTGQTREVIKEVLQIPEKNPTLKQQLWGLFEACQRQQSTSKSSSAELEALKSAFLAEKDKQKPRLAQEGILDAIINVAKLYKNLENREGKANRDLRISGGITRTHEAKIKLPLSLELTLDDKKILAAGQEALSVTERLGLLQPIAARLLEILKINLPLALDSVFDEPAMSSSSSSLFSPSKVPLRDRYEKFFVEFKVYFMQAKTLADLDAYLKQLAGKVAADPIIITRVKKYMAAKIAELPAADQKQEVQIQNYLVLDDKNDKSFSFTKSGSSENSLLKLNLELDFLNEQLSQLGAQYAESSSKVSALLTRLQSTEEHTRLEAFLTGFSQQFHNQVKFFIIQNDNIETISHESKNAAIVADSPTRLCLFDSLTQKPILELDLDNFSLSLLRAQLTNAPHLPLNKEWLKTILQPAGIINESYSALITSTVQSLVQEQATVLLSNIRFADNDIKDAGTPANSLADDEKIESKVAKDLDADKYLMQTKLNRIKQLIVNEHTKKKNCWQANRNSWCLPYGGEFVDYSVLRCFEQVGTNFIADYSDIQIAKDMAKIMRLIKSAEDILNNLSVSAVPANHTKTEVVEEKLQQIYQLLHHKMNSFDGVNLNKAYFDGLGWLWSRSKDTRDAYLSLCAGLSPQITQIEQLKQQEQAVSSIELTSM